MSSIFLGLTAASLPFIAKSEMDQLRGQLGNLVFTFIGLAFVAGLTWLRASDILTASFDYLDLSPFQYVYLFASGMLAISAMILPGISGSTFLLILGVYVPTIGAVKSLLGMNFAVLPGLAALGLGIVCGAAFSVRLIRTALEKHRSRMIYLVLGLIADQRGIHVE